MKNPLSPLAHLLSRAMFWRKRQSAEATASEAASNEPEATAQAEAMDLSAESTATNEQAGAAAEPESTSQQGRLARLLGALIFWRRRAKPAPDANEDAVAVAEIATAQPASDDNPDAPPPRPLGKRILAFLLQKRVWIPLVATILLAVGAGIASLVLRTQHVDQTKAIRELEAAKLKLEQEKQALLTQRITPATAKQAAPTPAHESKAEPAIDTSTGTVSTATTNNDANAGDCVVSNKENVGESLKRCIAAFNQTSSGPGKK